MTAIGYRENATLGSNSANRASLGFPSSKTVKLMMFTKLDNASWAADRLNKRQGYPSAKLTLKCNRDAFKLDVGDAFVFNFPKYDISNMVCRVLSIQEEDVESEHLLISAEEDIEYTSNAPDLEPQEGLSKVPTDWALEALSNVGIFETPYVLSGDKITVIPVAARESGTELGYYLYMSVDGGTSYTKIDTVSVFNAYGTLVNAWPTEAQPYGRGTYQLGDDADIDPSELGLEIDFSSDFDVAQISSVTKSLVFGGTHMAVLGRAGQQEIISFQNIDAVAGYNYRYRLTGIYRARFDSDAAIHNAGSPFWFVGTGHRQQTEHPDVVNGATRHFKFVPFNTKFVGDISEASAVSLAVQGRAKKPYVPINFNGCGKSFHAEYPCSTTTSTTTSTTSTTA